MRRTITLLLGLCAVLLAGLGFFVWEKGAADRNEEIYAVEDYIPIKEKEEKEQELASAQEFIPPDFIHHNVPFVAQAPFANWEDPVYQDACEEASITMAIYWIQQKDLTLEMAYQEIGKLADLAQELFGTFQDSSAKDTVELARTYFGYEDISVEYNISVADIKRELARGSVVIVPVNGRILQNPHYTPPGPSAHMVVVVGYDDVKEEFITHDPGTRFGENFRYSYKILGEALQDYETGHREPALKKRTAMIIVKSR